MGFCDQTLSVDIDAEELCKTVALVPSVGKKTNFFLQILAFKNCQNCLTF